MIPCTASLHFRIETVSNCFEPKIPLFFQWTFDEVIFTIFPIEITMEFMNYFVLLFSIDFHCDLTQIHF